MLALICKTFLFSKYYLVTKISISLCYLNLSQIILLIVIDQIEVFSFSLCKLMNRTNDLNNLCAIACFIGNYRGLASE